jgi:hypothetical protein
MDSKHAVIEPFRGTRWTDEDLREFVEDVEYTAEDKHPAPCDRRNLAYQRIFRNHLVGEASAWYRNLAEETRADWTTLKKEFFATYVKPRDVLSERFIIMNQISTHIPFVST